MRIFSFLVYSAVIACATNSFAGFSYTTPGDTEVITFQGFTGAGFQPSPGVGQLDSDMWAVTGWSNGDLAFGGIQVTEDTDYTRGATSGTVTEGGMYAFTSTPGVIPANPSLGFQSTQDDWTPGTITFQIVNNTGLSIDSGQVGFDLFVRNDQNRSSSFNFSYATGTLNTPGAFILPGGIDDYTSVAAEGTAGWTTARSASSLTNLTSLGLVAPGESIFLRWSGNDVGGSGSRDEFALDNITFSFTAVPEPASAGGALCLLGAWFLRRRKRS